MVNICPTETNVFVSDCDGGDVWMDNVFSIKIGISKFNTHDDTESWHHVLASFKFVVVSKTLLDVSVEKKIIDFSNTVGNI